MAIDFGEQMLREDAPALLLSLQEWAASLGICCEKNAAFPGLAGTIKLSRGPDSMKILVRKPQELDTTARVNGVWGLAIRYWCDQEDAALLARWPRGWELLRDEGCVVAPKRSLDLGLFLQRKLNFFFHLEHATRAASQRD